jgi:O-antigen/teichoic acid export membrane protein
LKPFDAGGTFRFTPDDVPRRAVRGAGATLLSSASGLAIQVISTMILARLLVPADFGLVGMVSLFSLLLVNCGPNGFTEAILQVDEINHFLASNLFWVNLGLGFLLTIGFAAAGTLLARFYGDPRITRVAVGMSVTILIGSTSVQHVALLKRAMRFSVVSANDVLARLVSTVVSIALGWAGWGYWALVAGSVALSLSTSIGAWSLCRWVPGRPRGGVGTRPMVRFAIHTYGRFSANYFANNTDNLLVGWRFGATSLGYYKKAYDLFNLQLSLSTASLTNVAVSALSRFRANPVKYRQHLLGILSVVAFVAMGLGADLTLVGKDLIRLLLGPGWESAGRIFTLFGPGIGIMILYQIHGWINLSIGRADRWFRWGLIEAAFTVLLLIMALPWGPEGIALAWTTSYFVLITPAFWYAGKPIEFGFAPVLATIWKYLVASLLAGCASAAIAKAILSTVSASSAMGALIRMVTISSLFLVLYLTAVILLHGGCAPLYQFILLLRGMLPSGVFSKLSPEVAETRVTDSNGVLTP